MLLVHVIMKKARKMERNVNKQERGQKGMKEAGGERERDKNALIQVLVGMAGLSGWHPCLPALREFSM